MNQGTARSPRTGKLLCCVVAFLAAANVPGADRLIFQEAVLTGKAGTVEYSIAGGPWTTAIKDQKLPYNSRVQTRLQSSAILRLADKTELQLDELSMVDIREAPVRTRPQISFLRGFFYLFTRDAPGETPFSSPHAAGGHRGTEFEVRVTEDRTIVNVLDGEVGLTNDAGSVVVPSLRRAEAVGNQAPQITAVIQATNLVQWWLYYPAVLNVDELKFGEADLAALNDAIAAYRNGDLRKALQSYPQGRAPLTEDERMFRASLLLSAGQVQQAESLLDGIPAH